MDVTPGDMRTNAEKIADAALKARILRGIAVLEEKVGPDWPDKVDPMMLDLGSARYCVLGQLYHDAPYPSEDLKAETMAVRPADFGCLGFDDGYGKGIAYIDGPLWRDGVEAYAFNREQGESYERLDAAWLVAFGEVSEEDEAFYLLNETTGRI